MNMDELGKRHCAAASLALTEDVLEFLRSQTSDDYIVLKILVGMLTGKTEITDDQLNYCLRILDNKITKTADHAALKLIIIYIAKDQFGASLTPYIKGNTGNIRLNISKVSTNIRVCFMLLLPDVYKKLKK